MSSTKNLGGIQKGNQHNSHDFPTFDARLSSLQLGREGNIDLEGSLHWHHDRDSGNFPHPTMVTIHTPGGATNLVPQTIQREPQGISIRSDIRAARLQCGAICVNWNGDAGA